MSRPRQSKQNSAECLVSGPGFCLVGVYVVRSGKQFLAGVAISRPADNWSPLGINTVWRGLAGSKY